MKSKINISNKIEIAGVVSCLPKRKIKNSVVFNFAAIADIQDSYNNPLKTLNVNIICCANILKACVHNKVKKFILASSIYANTSQGGFYRVNKENNTKTLEALDLNKNQYFKSKKIDLKIDKVNLLELINRNDIYGKYSWSVISKIVPTDR